MRNLADSIPSDKPVAMCTVGELLGYIMTAIGANQSPNESRPLTAAQVAKCRPVTPGWLKEHVPAAGKGPRRQPLYLLSAVDAELAKGAKPAQPRVKRPKLTGVNVDPIDQMIARGELRRVGGAR